MGDVEYAVPPTLGIFVGLVLAQVPAFKPVAGFMVVGMQCMMSVRAKGSLKERLKTLLYVILILTGTIGWGIVSTMHSFTMFFGVILLTLALTYWRHFFPDDWRNINTPSAALFFLTLATKPTTLFPVEAVFLSGFLGIALQAVLWWLWPSAYETQSALVRLKSQRARNRKCRMDFSLVTNVKPELWKYGMRLGLLLLLSSFLAHVSGRLHSYWIALTVIIVLQDSHADTLKRTTDRILGTFVGCLIGSALLVLHPLPELTIPLLVVCMFTFLLLVRNYYPVACVFLTIYIILLIGHQFANTFTVALERAGFTLAGGLLVVMSSYILFWKRTKA
ncbi:MAG: FUSC family protein [Siphonobacter sp.]